MPPPANHLDSALGLALSAGAYIQPLGRKRWLVIFGALLVALGLTARNGGLSLSATGAEEVRRRFLALMCGAAFVDNFSWLVRGK